MVHFPDPCFRPKAGISPAAGSVSADASRLSPGITLPHQHYVPSPRAANILSLVHMGCMGPVPLPHYGTSLKSHLSARVASRSAEDSFEIE